jgi:hypothetical protein
MSATVIALLSASAETPGMAPCVTSAHALADASEGLVPAQADFTPAQLSEIEPTQTDLAEAEAMGGEPAREGPTLAAHEATISENTHVPGGDPDLWLYRDRTVALLRRYMRLSIEVGRMPSLLGREFFRARVTSYKASTFEDSVIFVHDVERSLEELNEFERKLIARVVLQHYSLNAAGRVLGCGYRTVQRLLPDTLDRVSEIFLKRGILAGLHRTKPVVPKSCQGGKNDEIPSSQ